MARDIPIIERQISSSPIGLPMISAGTQLINSLQGFSNLAARIGETAATESAALAGASAREQGKEVNLAPGITRPTAAYNQAYRNTDARLVGRAGLDMIADATVKANDPRTLNAGSLEAYDSNVSGIIDGVLSQALPENRGAIQDTLLRAASSGRQRVQQSVINFNNRKLKQDFTREYNLLKEQRTAELMSAPSEDKEERIQQADADIAQLFQDWGTLSEEIRLAIPDLVQQLSEEETKARTLGDFIAAQSAGNGNEFLNSFVQTDHKEMTPQVKLDLISQMVSINNKVKSAQAGSQAVSVQRIVNDIDDPTSPTHISTQEQLEQSEDWGNITPLQKEQLSHKLIVRNNKQLREQQKFASAMTDISNGRAAFVKKSTINDMFTAALERIESESGRKASINDMFTLVQGLQTNVPKFDALMSDMLTNQNATIAAEAGTLYATASVADKENLISLSGDAASVAEKMTTLFNLIPNPEKEDIEAIHTQVLKRGDAQVTERLKEATTAWAKSGASYYEEVMGVPPDSFQDQGAFAVFKQAFTSAMVRGNTAEEASRIARNAMKGWGTDKWAPEDNVIIAPPSKVLPMSQGTYNTRNQLILAFNGVMKANNALITPEQGRQPMKFSMDFTIPEEMSDTDFVYKALDTQKGPGLFFAMGRGAAPQERDVVPDQIWVEVDGVRSELKIISSPQTLASEGGGFIYGLFAKDKFGVYQQLQDPRTEDGLAYVTLRDVDQTAPGVAGDTSDERLVRAMNNTLREQRRAELRETYRNQIIENSTFPALTRLIDQIPSKPIFGGLFFTQPSDTAAAKARVTEFFENLSNEPASLDEAKRLLQKKAGVKREDKGE